MGNSSSIRRINEEQRLRRNAALDAMESRAWRNMCKDEDGISVSPPSYEAEVLGFGPNDTSYRARKSRRKSAASISDSDRDSDSEPIIDSEDNPLQTLLKYDIVFVVDDSESMIGSRWEEAQRALTNLIDKVARYDADGVDVHFLNSNQAGYNLTDPKEVTALFDKVKPTRGTPIGARLETLLGKYTDEMLEMFREHRYNLDEHIKPVVYVVITDGNATDDPATVIVNIAGRLDDQNVPLSQIGIQFVQIGNSSRATRFLRELDDDLSRKIGIRDIVDTTPYLGRELTDEFLIKVMLGGINRRVDNLGGRAMMY